MMWFFAVLVVLVMGGVAALAAGRGAPMTQAYDDRPDALVPKDGPLRPEDLRRVRFSLAFRGYRMSEVDALLDRIVRQLEPVDEAPSAPSAGVDAEPDTAGQGDVADTTAVREVRGDDPVT
jgi:DivIVA domain-containing protein